MSGAEGVAARKQAYFSKLIKLLEEYPKIVICGADNVGSSHMQQIRKTLRGKAVLLMGKNTMIRKAIRGQVQNNPALEALLPHIKGNVGFVFTKEDLAAVRQAVVGTKVAAPAKPGAIAPLDVTVKAGPTGLEPTQTSFLQALNIPSKIAKGQIEIINDVVILTKGQKVGASEANLLSKLNIKPFLYGLIIRTVYDNGSVYDAKVLDITDDDIIAKFQNAARKVASVSLATGIPTVASLPHVIARGFKNVLSISLGVDFPIKQTQLLQSAAKAPPPAAAAVKAEEKKAPAKEEKKKVEEEEEEDFGAGGLFGDD